SNVRRAFRGEGAHLMNRWLVACLAAAFVCLTACGTTVPLTRQASGTTGSSPFVAPSATPGSPAVGEATGTNGTTGAASATVTGGESAPGELGQTGASAAAPPTAVPAADSGPSTSVVPGSTAPASPLPPTGRAWDTKVVHIGVTTSKDAESVYAAAGFAGLSIGDTTAQATAVANYINGHGGLLGRKVTIDFDDVPTLLSATNPDQYANQVCTHYAQDRPVVAVVNIVTTMDVPNFRQCLAKAGIPLFSLSDTATDDAVMNPLSPYFYSVITPSWDELAPALVRRLQAQGWFG